MPACPRPSIILPLILSIALSNWLADAQTDDPTSILAEMTGLVPSPSRTEPGCTLHPELNVWLCIPRAHQRSEVQQSNRAAAIQAMYSGVGLFIIDSTNKRLMVFDANSGQLLDDAFIELDMDATGTAIHALMSPSGEVLISDQTRHVVHRYALDGEYLGVFAPVGGANTAIMQNIRGMAFRTSGSLIVTVGSGANANAIVEFDANGNHLGNFISPGSGGLNSPFDAFLHGENWLVSSINTNQILRYAIGSGNSLGELAAISSFPQQIAAAPGGNILVANFSGNDIGINEFTRSGASVGVYSPPGLSGYRGVHQLGNGNLLASTSTGVYEINRSGELVATHWLGAGRFIQPVVLEPLFLRVTVGLVPYECSSISEISVTPGSVVTYCWQVTNNTNLTLDTHDLIDSEQGVILEGSSLLLNPGQTIFITQPLQVDANLTNQSTWTAYFSDEILTASGSATVHVAPASIRVSKTVGPFQGSKPDSCPTESLLIVTPGTMVTYCFEIENTGPVALTLHDLIDDDFGTILESYPFVLEPGASIWLTESGVINQETAASATWTAYNPGPIDTASDSDDATVAFSDDVHADRFENAP